MREGLIEHMILHTNASSSNTGSSNEAEGKSDDDKRRCVFHANFQHLHNQDHRNRCNGDVGRRQQGERASKRLRLSNAPHPVVAAGLSPHAACIVVASTHTGITVYPLPSPHIAALFPNSTAQPTTNDAGAAVAAAGGGGSAVATQTNHAEHVAAQFDHAVRSGDDYWDLVATFRSYASDSTGNPTPTSIAVANKQEGSSGGGGGAAATAPPTSSKTKGGGKKGKKAAAAVTVAPTSVATAAASTGEGGEGSVVTSAISRLIQTLDVRWMRLPPSSQQQYRQRLASLQTVLLRCDADSLAVELCYHTANGIFNGCRMLEAVLKLMPCTEAAAAVAAAAAVSGTDSAATPIIVDGSDDEEKKEHDSNGGGGGGGGSVDDGKAMETDVGGEGDGSGNESSGGGDAAQEDDGEEEGDVSVYESLLAMKVPETPLDLSDAGAKGDPFVAAHTFVTQYGKFVVGTKSITAATADGAGGGGGSNSTNLTAEALLQTQPTRNWLHLACAFLKKMICTDTDTGTGTGTDADANSGTNTADNTAASEILGWLPASGPMSEEAVLRMMHGAMLIVVGAAAAVGGGEGGGEGRRGGADQSELEAASSLYNSIRASLQRVAGKTKDAGSGGTNRNSASNAAPTRALCTDQALPRMLFELDLLPFSSSLQASPMLDGEAEHNLAFSFLIPPSSQSRERFPTSQRDVLLYRHLDVQATVRRCFRCHNFAPLCTIQSHLVDRMWAIACPCGGSFYGLSDLHNPA
jgi:hypothetical protein